ncbi:MAG: hypothetical protein RBS55_00910 [Bacteroidales bacterium]|jgi:hypothetical protein|nr:hypothetical protein [Bacteroidales bacterium]
MLLIRLSGHSCAGKTRLVIALGQQGLTCPKVLRYTSRAPRSGETDGEDYFFRTREYIASLPEKDFLVGPVRNMMQAFDLHHIETLLRSNPVVIIEIYPALWPMLISRMSERLGNDLKTASVFLTAVDPRQIKLFRTKEEKAGYIASEVYKMLLFRNKDHVEDIKIRACSAAVEILEALSPAGRKQYEKIIFSAPEGPDGQDEWTREYEPAGQAKTALEDFITMIRLSAGP